MWRLTEPSPEQVRELLDAQALLEYSYPHVGRTRSGLSAPPPGFDLDHNRVLLGEGPAAFAAARSAVDRWAMFPAGWTRVEARAASLTPAGYPAVREGTVVAMVARALGVWWTSACRIVYTLDEEGSIRRYGFAYGTLPGHVERGEERFSVELLADGTVWYDLLAFSRPRYWMARLGYPLARRLQRRFVEGSLAAMRAAMTGAGRTPEKPQRHAP